MYILSVFSDTIYRKRTHFHTVSDNMILYQNKRGLSRKFYFSQSTTADLSVVSEPLLSYILQPNGMVKSEIPHDWNAPEWISVNELGSVTEERFEQR